MSVQRLVLQPGIVGGGLAFGQPELPGTTKQAVGFIEKPLPLPTDLQAPPTQPVRVALASTNSFGSEFSRGFQMPFQAIGQAAGNVLQPALGGAASGISSGLFGGDNTAVLLVLGGVVLFLALKK